VADLALDVDAVVASHPARCVHPVGTTTTGVPGEPAEVVAP
jgi:hypothetical protein